MMKQSNRLKRNSATELIDRNRPIEFSWNGRPLRGYEGDTLASALLANGERLIARSFKTHRPRGIFSAGSEEPNALVQLRRSAFTEPNTRATTTQLYNGLAASSQHHRGSLKYDLMAFMDLVSPLLSAGFYYKTFMWPKSFWESVYEPLIRAAAGLGRLSGAADPGLYDKGFLHCDILIIGAGPAGLAAALAAGRSGARVILADEDFSMGGRLNRDRYEIDGARAANWTAAALAELQSMDHVRLAPRTTVWGAFDHGIYGAVECVTDHLPAMPAKPINQDRDEDHDHDRDRDRSPSKTCKPRQILWRIYAQRTILCAGASERPIAFGNNDRPGIMLAGAVRSYVNRWGVAPGKHFAIFTNNDDGWRTAADLANRGVKVRAIIDSRDIAPPHSTGDAEIIMGGRIIDTKGRSGLRAITLANGQQIETDCLAVSGGWNPNVHLTCHHGSRPLWRDDICAFVPAPPLPAHTPARMVLAGAANGALTLYAALQQGHTAGAQQAQELGFTPTSSTAPRAQDEPAATSPFWHVTQSTKRAWLDLQNDVTVKDIALAYKEGYRSVEHVKRYTTLSMGTDQGKTANIPALAVLAKLAGTSIRDIGTTMYRPPFTPVTIGAFAGRARGTNFRPHCLPPSHDWARAQGAVFTQTGLWQRAQYYPRPGESHWRQTVDREVLQTRNSVGICDVSTLGKIDIQGDDAAQFINHIYCNAFGKLKIGKTRYGLMLREDGMVMDDGTTARLAQTHFIMTTTTANAAAVYRHLEFCRQCLWPDLSVHLTPVTEQWAQYAIAGPKARTLLQKIVDPAFELSNDAFPFMACAEITICGGITARLFRISFSGELAYELAAPARYGDALIRTLMSAGKDDGAAPYGTEALNVMRIEKGHAAGNELNGQTTAHNLGMGQMVSKKKDAIGIVLSRREELCRADALRLSGFIPKDRAQQLQAGAHFIAKGQEASTQQDQGWMSSTAYSPTLGHSIGLGFIRAGADRHGETVSAVDLLRGRSIDVEIVSPHFLDPQGERLHG